MARNCYICGRDTNKKSVGVGGLLVLGSDVFKIKEIVKPYVNTNTFTLCKRDSKSLSDRE